MIKSYIKIFLRNLKNRPAFNLITILGLSVGIMVSLFIALFVIFEKSYDSFHENADNIYCLQSGHYDNDELKTRRYRSPSSMGATLKSEYPEVLEYVKLEPQGGWLLRYNKHSFKVRNAWYASSSFFNVFTYQFLYGNPSTALNEKNSIVISESLAKKLFGNQNPIGKTIMDEWANQESWLTVTGVIKDVPKNSHLKFDLLCKLDENYLKNNWTNFGFRLYLLLDKNTNIESLESKLVSLYNKKQGGTVKKEFLLKPLKNIHLYSDELLEERSEQGDISIIRLLSMVVLSILVIVWINYINLSALKTFDRAKEIGLKKVIGARRAQIISQFLFESIVINITALLIGIILLELFLPLLNNTFGLTLSWSYLNNYRILLVLALTFLGGTLFSGGIVATILSSYKAISVIHGIKENHNGVTVRKVMVIFQFVIAAVLISCTATVYYQIYYMRNQPLGFNLDNILLVNRPDGNNTDIRNETFMNELKNNSNILNVSLSCYPGQQYYARWKLARVKSNYLQTMKIGFIDEEFIDTYEIEILAGRNLSKELSSDKNGIIINKTAVKMYGFESPTDAIGEFLAGYGDTVQIIGVIKDYNQLYLKEPVSPTGLVFSNYSPEEYFSVKIRPENTERTMEYLEKKYMEILGDYTYDYVFLKDYYNQQYKNEWEFGNMFALFSFLAILITCLGLWALISHMLHCRTKEIAIRKVFGSSLLSLFYLFYSDLFKLSLISIFVAIPISYLLMHKWLTNYANHIKIGIWFIILPFILLIFITFSTTIYRIIRAGAQNAGVALKEN